MIDAATNTVRCDNEGCKLSAPIQDTVELPLFWRYFTLDFTPQSHSAKHLCPLCSGSVETALRERVGRDG